MFVIVLKFKKKNTGGARKLQNKNSRLTQIWVLISDQWLLQCIQEELGIILRYDNHCQIFHYHREPLSPESTSRTVGRIPNFFWNLLHFLANDSHFCDEYFCILLTKKGYIEISMMRVSESNQNGVVALLSIHRGRNNDPLPAECHWILLHISVLSMLNQTER